MWNIKFNNTTCWEASANNFKPLHLLMSMGPIKSLACCEAKTTFKSFKPYTAELHPNSQHLSWLNNTRLVNANQNHVAI